MLGIRRAEDIAPPSRRLLTVRDVIPKARALARAEFTTTRLRLLKLGARMIETTSRYGAPGTMVIARCLMSAASGQAAANARLMHIWHNADANRRRRHE